MVGLVGQRRRVLEEGEIGEFWKETKCMVGQSVYGKECKVVSGSG